MEMKSIFIDLELFRFLETKRESFDESYNDILKRVLIMNKISRKESIKSNENKSGLYWKGVFFRDGLNLRGFYKGLCIEAIVKNGKINYNGNEFTSPSAAAIKATNMNMSGWSFWEYHNDKTKKWETIANLKNNLL